MAIKLNGANHTRQTGMPIVTMNGEPL